MLSFYKYPGDEVPIIKGTALCALEGRDDKIGKDKVLELIQTVDEYFTQVFSPFPLFCSRSVSWTRTS